jgi:pimeloyl-ACP methyl ester carboxylesterase
MAGALPVANKAAHKSDGLVQVDNPGLTVLYEPETNAPKADVVFVHGLQGHPHRTWRYKGPITKTTDVHENPFPKIMGFAGNKSRRPKDMTTTGLVYWPLELLPDTHGDIRILTYGYDSNVSNWFTGPANKMTIAKHGHSLLSDLAQKREDSRGRPMIFVAHSLGGLVVKEALIEARKQKYHNHLNEIYLSCEAIIFFGTPHRGSGLAKWAVLLGNIASAAQFDTNTGVARDLVPSGGSDKLEELRRDFHDILEEGKIKIHTFQEGFGIKGLGIVGSKIVPDESSSFDSRKFEVVDTISANHMDMCRFGSKDDNGYKKFVGALANFLRHVDCQAKEIAERMKAERKEELLRSLDFAERQAREHQLSSGDTATFDWIWSTKSSGTTFVDWLSGAQGLFWISGKPGSGKSTLMSYLAGDRKTLSFLRRHTELPWTIMRFFFDFRAGKGTANSLAGLLRTLLLQLVQNVPELTTRVLEFAKDRFGESQVLDWPEKKLRQSLLDGLKACPCNVCIFVDGLDEYDGNMLDLFKVLADVDDSCGSLPHVVKLCLASRPEPLLAATL